MLFVPLLTLRDYVSEFVVPFVAILVTFSLLLLARQINTRRKAMAVGFVAVVLVSGGFGWIMKDYWATRYSADGSMSDATFETALYVRHRTEGALVANEGLHGGRVNVIADGPVLPLGGASLHWYTAEQVNYGFVNLSRVDYTLIDLTQVTFQHDWIFTISGAPNAKDGFENIMYHPLDDRTAVQSMTQYGIHTAIVLKGRPYEFSSYIWRASPFLVSLDDGRYKIFENSELALWHVR